MSSHPDADSFVRQFLRHPQDETARLVFADWLEDTGEPHNLAWAGYIRAKATAAREEFGTDAWRASDDEAAEFAPDIVATLTLPVGFFLRYPASLLRLLPGPNVTVQLGGVELPPDVVELIPEAVAREVGVLPLQSQPPALLVAMADPRDRYERQRLRFTLGREVIPLRAEADDLAAASDAAYARMVVDIINGGLVEFVDVARLPPEGVVAARPDDPVARLIDWLIGEALDAEADRLRLIPAHDRRPTPAEVRPPAPIELSRRSIRGVARQFARYAAVEDQWSRFGRAAGTFRYATGPHLCDIRMAAVETADGPQIDIQLGERETID